MRFLPFRGSRGQALVMVTLALMAMFGIIGLAVDLGWSFYLRKSERAAADAAALAAVRAASVKLGPNPIWSCSNTNITCAAVEVQCPSAPGNLATACEYAVMNGYTAGQNNVKVTVQASDAGTPPTVSGCNPTVSYPPTAPCVGVLYWVTVRVSQQVPQLFSAALGNMVGTVAHRSTAAVAEQVVPTGLRLLNREHDLWNLASGGGSCVGSTGSDLCLGGGPTVYVPNGISLASNGNSANSPADPAGSIQGSGSVVSPYTYIRTGGNVSLGGSGSWVATPSNLGDGSVFQDPFDGMGQPPLNPSQATLSYIKVPGGVINSNICPSLVCAPGNYYATVSATNTTPTGAPLQPVDGVRFSSGSSGFGDYVFFGGMNIGQATITFNPARYVMAGALAGNMLFSNDNKALLQGGNINDPGRIFILTDSSYGGALASVTANIPNLPTLGFGISAFKSGDNAGSGVTMYGLNSANGALPANLQSFAPVVVWQDRANSNVKYNPDGTINYSTSCGGTDINHPCYNTNTSTRELQLWATPNSSWTGVIYQPRGAWTVLQAAGHYTGAMMLVSGAMSLQGSGTLTLTGPPRPFTLPTVGLVE